MDLKFKVISVDFIIIFLLLFIIICPMINANGDSSAETGTTISPVDIHMYQTDEGKIMEITGISFNQNNNYHLSVENSAGSTVFTSDFLKEAGVKSFTAKNIGTINIENSIDSIDSIFVENGYAKINFIKGKSSATFEINGKGYTFNSDGGYVEWKDDGMFLGENIDLFTIDKEGHEIHIHSNSDKVKIIIEDDTPIVVGEANTDVIINERVIFSTTNGKKIKSIEDKTNIRIEDNIPTVVKGKISVDYETSPFKINLYGTYTSLELNTADDEKFEFKNIDPENNLLVTISSIDNYMFHDGCKTNCISYRDMGKGHSGDPWDKIKIDGAAKVIKYKDNEKGYSLTFSNGKATIGRKFLASMRDIPFNKKTVINYNNGDIDLTIFKSQEEAIIKRNDLKKELENSVERIKQASYGLTIKEEEFEKLKNEMGYEELPEELPEKLKQAKEDLDKAELELTTARKQKDSISQQIYDMLSSSLWIKGKNREGNVEILPISMKEMYDSSIEKLWLFTHRAIEEKDIYDVTIDRTFPEFPYIDEEVIYESKETRFDLYNKNPEKDEDYSVYELAEKYAVKTEDIPIIIALWYQESKFDPDVINEDGYIGLGQIKAESGAPSDVASYYKNEFPEYKQYAGLVDDLTKSEINYLNEELKKREVNVRISTHYFRMMEDKYYFDKLEYQLTGYNAGPTATGKILKAFKGNTWEEYKTFLFSDYAIGILSYGNSKNAGRAKAKEIVGYIEKICGSLGYDLV
ncbi:MAG: hypothetical protein KKE93_04220 [Nanoarchaeota archaeon]|nr:hypothetical protein [Nanoarchaeota archaeon]